MDQRSGGKRVVGSFCLQSRPCKSLELVVQGREHAVRCGHISLGRLAQESSDVALLCFVSAHERARPTGKDPVFPS